MAKRAKKTAKAADNWELSIYVPQHEVVEEEEEEEEEETPGKTTNLHMRGAIAEFFLGKEEKVEASKVKDQWRQTIDGIVSTVGEWTSASSGRWKIDEVSFGLVLEGSDQPAFRAS
jgi:hypothetical protein